MPVGNDVVDLADPENQPGAIHPRFDSRAFSTRERAFLEASSQGHVLRWTLWACKESAFKACRKLDPAVRFIPRAFSIDLAALRNGHHTKVEHARGTFNVWLDTSKESVHAQASLSEMSPEFTIALSSSATDGAQTSQDPSEAARQLARSTLSKALEISARDITIVSGEDGIPLVEILNEPSRIDLSLSHDGRFVACAWDPASS